MLRKCLLLLVFVALACFYPLTSASADGIIIVDPPICARDACPPPLPPLSQLAIKYHHVTVTIQDQLAVTHVDQVFYNPNDWQIEGLYTFPLPADAAVTSFTLWIDGQPVEGKVLSAEEARRAYEDIVRRMADPALLEYAGRGAVQARIFPIPPQGERRIELEYTQALAAENGLIQYTYPLNTEKFSQQPLQSVSISVEVRSSAAALRAAYSPTHPVNIVRDGDFHLSAGYEAENVRPDADFALYYSLGESEAFHLLSYRDPSDPTDPDGFFLLLLAPRPQADAQPLPKDVFVVLDRSGSMEGEKFQQAQQALRYLLSHLNAEDRFNLVVFSNSIERYAEGLRPAVEADEAIAWVDRLTAQGSTDINRALLETAGMVENERPTYVIFLTDGLPTYGEIDSQKVLDNLAQSAPPALRMFVFGVGYDVDTFLLDSLAQAHHGASSYVLPGEALDEIVSGFYAKISTPVLTNLGLDFGDIAVHDLYPSPLPDLFDGSQIIAVGRYRRGGGATAMLTGEVNGRTQTFTFSDIVFADAPTSFVQLPRLWATRKIGYLLNQVRLRGADQETIDQIVKLSIRYGIVTPYTSYLVTEEMAVGAEAQKRIAEQEFKSLEAAPPAPSSGQAAVQDAAGQGALSNAEVAAAPEQGVNSVKIVASRTFVLLKGVWTDTAFDPAAMQTVKVLFLSDDYFALTAARPDLAAAFALGKQVIAIADGVAYQVIESGVPDATLPAARPTPTAQATSAESPATQSLTATVRPPTLAPPCAPTRTPQRTPFPTAVETPSSPRSGGARPCLGVIPLGLLAGAPAWMRARKNRRRFAQGGL